MNHLQIFFRLLRVNLEQKKGEKLILNGMARDYFQREKLNLGLRDVNDDDLILISDLDEIPNLENFVRKENLQKKILIFEQKMFYYKLNLFYEDFIWYGSKGFSKKFYLPQWLRNIKVKKYPKWRLDILLSKKKYSNLQFIKNGGWHFTCLKLLKKFKKKLLNFAHHYEFEESGLKIDDLKKLVSEKRVMYDHNIDQKGYKWAGNSKLKKIDNNSYLITLQKIYRIMING